jgi:hypothetical protein
MLPFHRCPIATWLVTGLMLCLCMTSAGQSDQEAAGAEEAAAPAQHVPAAFDSPHSTLKTFLEAMGDDPPDLDRAVECMDVSEVVEEKAPDLALWLYKCINRIEWVYFDDRPYRKDPDLLTADQLDADDHSYTLFPRDVSDARWIDRAQYERARELAGPDASIVIVRTDSGAWKFSAETVAGIEPLWDSLKALPPVREFQGEEYLTLTERLESLWPASLREGRFLAIEYWQWISLFILIVALNMISALTMLVMEKHRDIGIMKSFGTPSRVIKAIFIRQGMTLALRGTLLGTVIGVTLAWVADSTRLIKLDNDVYEVLNYLPFEVHPLEVVLVAIGSMLLSLVTCIYPAHQAAKLDPVEALKYD